VTGAAAVALVARCVVAVAVDELTIVGARYQLAVWTVRRALGVR
jgi:hypothetical protein